MPRVTREFECSSCSKIFDIKLNTSLNGNYRIHCPHCEHIHYRKVSDGVITSIRFPDNSTGILIEDIRPMKSSCRDFSMEIDKDSYFNKDKGESALYRSWKDKFSCS
jgi:DNA-directed RNA polymerase subunit RPC12/RpoP